MATEPVVVTNEEDTDEAILEGMKTYDDAPTESAEAADGEPADGDKAAEPEKTNAEESNGQKRRRLQREAKERTLSELNRSTQEAAKLRERVRQLENKIPDRTRYGQNEADYVADRAAVTAQHMAATDQLQEIETQVRAAEEEERSLWEQERADFLAEGSKKYQDFEKTVTNENLRITPAMLEALMDEGMHDTLYDLAKKPAELAAIAALPTPLAQVKAILKAQAALEAKAASKASKAPVPIKPIKGSAAISSKPVSEMTYTEYAAYREKQQSSRR